MNDAETNLQEIKDKVFAFAKERDWEQFHSPKNLSMAVSAEAAELMEHFYGNQLISHVWMFSKLRFAIK